MNNNRPHLPAARTGGGASLLRRINEKQAGNEANDSSASATNEGIVQNIQGFLLQVRRDRDRNHRIRDITL